MHSGRPGDGDAVQVGDVEVGEEAALVDRDVVELHAAVTRRRHLDDLGAARQAPQLRGGTERHGVRARAREACARGAADATCGRAGDAVHAFVHPFEPPRREPMLDLTLGYRTRAAVAGDDVVLPPGQLEQKPVEVEPPGRGGTAGGRW